MNKKVYCSECKREMKNDHSFFVDDRPVCYECLFGKVEPVMIYPIGKVSQVNSDGISRIDLFSYQQRFMYKLEEEKRITIVYYLDKVNSINTIFKRGREGTGKEVGVFASRSPYRSSRIAISDVELIRISNLSIYVKGLDAYENSPVLDIKVAKKAAELKKIGIYRQWLLLNVPGASAGFFNMKKLVKGESCIAGNIG